MKSGTNRLITERYITNTERSVGNLSYITPLPFGFSYPNFTDEAIQAVKNRFISLEKSGVKYYQNVVDAKKENDELIIKTKWKQIKAEDIPIYYESTKHLVVIGFDKSIDEVDPRISLLLGIANFQPFAIEAKPDTNLLIYDGTVPELSTFVNIIYFNGENFNYNLDNPVKLNLNMETLPRADYIIGL